MNTKSHEFKNLKFKKMSKKITFYLLVVGASLTFQPLQSNAATTSKTEPVTVPMTQTEANTLTLRLNEINTLDKSSLTHKEKKALRGEVKTIEKQLRSGGGGVYISVGAIIIIILLLIILL